MNYDDDDNDDDDVLLTAVVSSLKMATTIANAHYCFLSFNTADDPL